MTMTRLREKAPAQSFSCDYRGALNLIVIRKSCNDPIHLAWMVKEAEQLEQRKQ